MNELDRFLIIFLEALDNIADVYFRTVYDNVHEIRNAFSLHYRKQITDDQFIDTGERVFCYELYHQLRNKIDEKRQQEHFLENTLLQGEVHKKQILGLLERFHLRRLSQNFIPDFLLHTPGSAISHPYIIEVKADNALGFPSLKYDLGKIVEFITKYDYQRGIFLSVTTTDEHVPNLIKSRNLLEEIPKINDCLDKILIINKHSDETDTYHQLLCDLI